MNVLITGFSGFLGQHIARALMGEDFSVRVLLHRHTVSRSTLDKDAEVIWGSVGDREVVRQAVKGMKVVVHSAWTFSSPGTQRPTVNELGADLLLEESALAGVDLFAFLSSVTVYGMAKTDTIMKEDSPLASGRESRYIYPSEKVRVENTLQAFERKNLKVGIFRPGPIFDDRKGPARTILGVGGTSFAIGLGNGKNSMPFIHAKDVATAVAKWIKNGQNDAVFNVTPTYSLRYMDWYRVWGMKRREPMKTLFIRPIWVRLGYFGVRMLKKLLHKPPRADINYAIESSRRDIEYSNKSLKQALGWNDDETAKFTSFFRK